MQEKTRVSILFCALVVFLLLCLVKPSTQEKYLIWGTELDRLETIWQESQTDKQNWLLLVTKLNKELTTLKPLVQTLNSQLKTERQATQDLRKSFEKLENEKLTKYNDYETRISTLKEEKETAKNDAIRYKNARNDLFFILAVIGIFGLVVIYFKIRPKLKVFFPFLP